jgi:CDP-6-deoxy-D-xylo-4-hexulose-3-dehydrase
MSAYPLATSSWDNQEKQAMLDVMETGMYTMGQKVKKFEQDFANFMDSKHAIMVNSGSTANLLMVAALCYRKESPLKAGDEVIVPAVSWSTTYYPLHQYGLKMKFVDIDKETLNFDLQALEGAITDKTRLIMAVNLLGNANEFDAIEKMIQGKDIELIEDNCESMGATYQGKQCGSFGLMGSFSTFFSHHMCTMEGGLIITDDEEMMQLCRAIRAHGWTRDLPEDNLICPKGDDDFQESFRFVIPAYGVRPTELQGATGSVQLSKLPTFIENRRNNAKIFMDMFGGRNDIIFQKEIGESSWFGFSMVITENAPYSRSELVEKLRLAGIDSRPIVAGNFTRNPVMKYMPHTIHHTLENADLIHDHGLFVGNHQYPMQQELEALAKIL